jgi:hypothetical protein
LRPQRRPYGDFLGADRPRLANLYRDLTGTKRPTPAENSMSTKKARTRPVAALSEEDRPTARREGHTAPAKPPTKAKGPTKADSGGNAQATK